MWLEATGALKHWQRTGAAPACTTEGTDKGTQAIPDARHAPMQCDLGAETLPPPVTLLAGGLHADASAADGSVSCEDRDDRMLSRYHFLSVQQLLKLQFTLDAACDPSGLNAHCPKFCSPAQSFLQQDLAGETVWMNPPYSKIREFIKHYLACKSRAPTTTSAALLLPQWHSAAWRALLEGMVCVKVYPRGTHLFSAPDPSGSRRQLPGTPWPVEVWYDAPRPPAAAPRLRLSAAATDATLMHRACMKAHVGGSAAAVLLDSGASVCFVSRPYIERLGIPYSPGTVTSAEIANGQSASVLGQAKLTVRFQGLKSTAVALVLDTLLPGVDLILGESWLSANSAVLDYGQGTVSLVSRNRRHTLRMTPSAAVLAAELGRLAASMQCPAELITRKQADKALRKQRRWPFLTERRPFLVAVREVKPAAESTDVKLPGPPPTEGVMPPERLQALLDKYKQVAEPLTTLPRVRPVPHAIELQPGTVPPYKQPYRLSQAEREEVDRQVTDLLAKGFIRPSSSPFGAPVLFVPKQDGALRMCIDYRPLNAASVAARACPIPRVSDLLDQLSGAKVFSALDLASGYHQIRIRDDDVPKTAFNTHLGQFEWLVLPFGLANAPSTFQRAMHDLFRPYIGKFVLIYLDDVLVFSRTPEEHAEHMETVLRLLAEHDFRLRMDKCQWNLIELKYLGFLVGRDGVRPDPSKVSTVANWPVPQSVTQLRSFLGLANFFRKFIQGYSSLVSPLTALTTNATDTTLPNLWNDACQRAFDGVKHSLTHAPLLAHPDHTKPYTVISDASVNGTGAVLLQEGRPVAYHSHKFTPAEHNWPTGEQELGAVMKALTEWRCYLEGAPSVQLQTDHHPLTYLKSQPNLSRKQARWLEFLSRFNYDWKYIPGRTNVADPISRIHAAVSAVLAAVRHVYCAVLTRAGSSSVSPKGGGDAGMADVTPAAVLPEEAPPAESDDAPAPCTVVEITRACRETYAKDDWFSKESNTATLTRGAAGLWLKDGKVVIPNHTPLKHTILHACHDAPTAGHPGVARTYEKVKRYYWWPAMKRDVEDYVRACPSCQCMKSPTTAPAGLLQPLPIPPRRWSSVSLDLITGLPRTKRGNDAILVFVDRLSKMVHLGPCKKSVTALGCADLFFQHVVRLHGAPDDIVSDRGTTWVNAFWEQLCSRWQIKQKLSSAFHPQTDGQTERMNRTLEETLRHYVGTGRACWDEHLPCAEFAINDSVNASTGFTPFFLNYGEHPKNPLLGSPHTGPVKSLDSKAFTEAIADAVRSAKEHLRAAQDRQKATADKHRRDVTYAVGDKVLLSTKNLRLSGARKLMPRYVGPFSVTALIGKTAAALELPAELPVHNVFHFSLLKPFCADRHSRPPPPLPALDESSPAWVVKAILSHRDVKAGTGRSKREYLVEWQTHGAEHHTWEPTEVLSGCDELIKAYLASKSAPAPAPVPIRRSPRMHVRAAMILLLPSERSVCVCCMPVSRRDDASLSGGQL